MFNEPFKKHLTSLEACRYLGVKTHSLGGSLKRARISTMLGVIERQKLDVFKRPRDG